MGAVGPTSGGAEAHRSGREGALAPSALQAQVSSEVRARVEAGSWRVPLLPQVASQVIALAAVPEVDAGKLSALIHRDPSLAGQVLRTANSAAYAPRMPIVSLQQAVARLGLSVISEIAFSASLQSGTFRVPGHERDLQALWRHSLGAGAWAKEVARLRRTNVESAFLCGLLHGVGKPALLQIAVDVVVSMGSADQLQRSWLPALFAEHESTVGARIAQSWALPGAVAAAIAHHQNPAGTGGDFPMEVQTTRLASLLASWSLHDAAVGEEQLREDSVLESLNLYPDDLDVLIAKREAVLAIVDALTV
jgi:putative nucleotidyltransferase with HDIG domain